MSWESIHVELRIWLCHAMSLWIFFEWKSRNVSKLGSWPWSQSCCILAVNQPVAASRLQPFACLSSPSLSTDKFHNEECGENLQLEVPILQQVQVSQPPLYLSLGSPLVFACQYHSHPLANNSWKIGFNKFKQNLSLHNLHENLR